MTHQPTRAGTDAVKRRDCIVEAFSTIIPPIAVRLSHKLGPITTKDDLTQIGFLGLLDAATRFEGYARKRIEGAMRDSLSKRDYIEAARPRYEDIAPMPDPRGDLIEIVLLSELYDAIDGLAAPEAEVLLLVASRDTQQEVADELGITQQGVSKRHRKAVEQLREKLAA